jgi:hypothetical protein
MILEFKHTVIGFSALVSLFFAACTKEGPTPAYLKINAFEVDAIAGGAAEHKIPHAFVYLLPNSLLGGFPTPGLVPIIAEGDTTIEIFAGIRENGSRQSPTVYPLMSSYKTTVRLVPGQITEVTPVVKYYPNVIVATASQENFDGNSVLPTDDKDGNSNTLLTIGSIDGFDGKYGKLNIDTGNVVNWIAFRQNLEGLPISGGQPVFLELHYKNTNPFELILFGSDVTGNNTETIPVFGFNNSADWNKIYINLTDFLSSTRYPKYQLQFRTTLERDITTGKFVRDSGAVYLDNMRVLYF